MVLAGLTDCFCLLLLSMELIYRVCLLTQSSESCPGAVPLPPVSLQLGTVLQSNAEHAQRRAEETASRLGIALPPPDRRLENETCGSKVG